MMFASDLDRTLIYSKRAIEEYSPHLNVPLKVVERRNGRDVSFMTNKAWKTLQQIATQCLFVPVTTRNQEQYKRVILPSLPTTYAVTTNGANILYKGKILEEWKCDLQSLLSVESLHYHDLITLIDKEFFIPGERRIVDDLFFYYYLSENLSANLLPTITSFLQDKGWSVSLQGNKVYFMPNTISKGNAVKFIRDREAIDVVTGAGDSLFDYDFLKNCQFPFVMSHGELSQHRLKERFTIIEQNGILGGEALLEAINSLICERV